MLDDRFSSPTSSRKAAIRRVPNELVALGSSGIAGRLVTQWQKIEASAPKSAELTASRLEPCMSMASPKPASQLSLAFEDEPAGVAPASAVPQPQPEPEQEFLDVGLTAEQRRGLVGYDKDGRFVHYCHCGEWGAFGYGVFLSRGQLGKWFCGNHRPGTARS